MKHREERNLPPALTPSDKADSARLSRPLEVARHLKQLIMDEGMQPGDRLPSEPILIEKLGRSKGTVREAMRILEAEGLVRTRTGPGGGAFVDRSSDEQIMALMANHFYFEALTLRDIYQLRLALEPELAASLAGRLTEQALEDLQAQMVFYANPPRNAEEEREQHVASLAFHRQLARHSPNPLLGLMIRFLARFLTDLTIRQRLYEPHNRELWKRGRDYQSQLLGALTRGDEKAARETMRAHMNTALRLMENQAAQVEQRLF